MLSWLPSGNAVPFFLLRGVVFLLWIRKGDRWDYSNYRGITLINIPCKIFAHIPLKRIRLLRHHRPEKSGFTPGKSTIDRIPTLRVAVERRREFGRELLAAYIDLKNAFDSVHHKSLWEILRLRGIRNRLLDQQPAYMLILKVL